MQDSVFSVIHRERALLDIVDDDWFNDCLSDDGDAEICRTSLTRIVPDIDIPQGAMNPGDDADDSRKYSPCYVCA